jgi:putative Ca2+/H+ antiporter (TMEM165/GDT1 family)
MSGGAVMTAAFAAVLAVELLGDRSLVAISALAGRYPPARIFAGVAAAFAVKMLAAVAVGRALGALPQTLLTAVSVATFVATAVVLWLRREEDERPLAGDGRGGVVAAFLSVFCSEWADAGQLTAAALVTRYGMPLAVWSGGTLALMTKGLIALAAGAALRRRLSPGAMRRVGVALCLAMGVAAALRIG